MRAISKVSVSVVTYTYNDNELVHALLDSIEAWSVSPAEIIIIDDFSAEKFEYNKTINGVVPTIIRNDCNRGPTYTKQCGISKARSKYILSIDADTRPTPQWLEICLPYVSLRSTGMVSTSVFCHAGESLAAEYLHATCSYTPHAGEVPIIPGHIFLIQKKIFDEIGGFSLYNKPIGEDVYLNTLLVNAGYKLLIAQGAHAYQVRKLSRIAIIKRAFIWKKNSFLDELKNGTPLGKVVDVFIYGVGKRASFTHNNKSIVYFDMLHCIHGILYFYKQFSTLFEEVCLFIYHYLGEFELLYSILCNDLKELGFEILQCEKKMELIIPSFKAIFPKDLCAFLNKECLLQIAKDNFEEDYSMYACMDI